MFPEIDLDRIREEIDYIEEQVVQSSRGIIPMFDFDAGDFVIDSRGRIKMLENSEAIKMWIVKNLHTYLNRYEIYYNEHGYREYGVDLKQNFFGKRLPTILILGELEREIREALLEHRLIKRVDNFDLSGENTTLTVRFDVVLQDDLGTVSIDEEVRIPSEEEVNRESRSNK